MINIKNITKVLLLAMFICAYSFEATGTDATCLKDSRCPQEGWTYNPNSKQCVKCPEKPTKPPSTPSKVSSSNTPQDATFCSSDKGVFGELVTTGITIFKGLRDLIYVVAGFGIIAVAVGGFFGNMNWKWLSAIVLALIVIASAGELIVLLTGCEQYGTTLITNTLKAPTKEVDVQSK